MMRDIASFKQQRQKSNKELAKAVVTWVSEAVSSSETHQQDDLFLQNLENGVENDEGNDNDAPQSSQWSSSSSSSMHTSPPEPSVGEQDSQSDPEEERGGWFSNWL